MLELQSPSLANDALGPSPTARQQLATSKPCGHAAGLFFVLHAMSNSAEPIHELVHVVVDSQGVSIDTRDDLNGKVFWALKGPRFNANDFVEQALEAGAVHVVSDESRWADTPHVTVVEDGLASMQDVAREVRRRWTCPVIALTGSNGKTTSKELMRDVLATRFCVHATRGNLNNHIGVPLTLLNAPKRPDVVIVEMGANHQREIDFLCEIAEPNHGYITNIGLAHLEGFGGEHGVYLGKKELFDWLGANGGTAFVLTSDAKVVEAAKPLTKVLHVDTEGWEWRPAKGTDRPQLCDNTGQCWSLHLEGQYNLGNCLAAVTIGQHFGVPKDMAMQAVSNYRPENHRSQVMETERNWVLLDAYNANPSSSQAAMDAFAAKGHGSPLLIMGDMAELGDASLDAHQRIIDLALEHGVELWTIGPWFGKARQATQSDHPHFDAVDDLMDSSLLSGLSNRQILIKGSRSMALEQLMPAL